MPRRLEWYAFYVGHYMIDTAHLTREQDYAYWKILNDIFWNGQEFDPPSIPADEAYLQHVAKASAEEWPEIRAALFEGHRRLLAIENGRVTQKRMTSEVRKALKTSAGRQKAANDRWEAERARKRPSQPRQRKKSGQPIPDHGGNGHGQISGSQRIYLATRVNKWLEDNRESFVGASNGGEFARAFHSAIGISWEEWLAISGQTQ